jgi:hypothetical protein
VRTYQLSSNESLRDATVIVRDGRIESVQSIKVEAPAGATLIDLKGAKGDHLLEIPAWPQGHGLIR